MSSNDRDALFDAVERNDLAGVRELLTHPGVDLETPDPRTPFADRHTVLMSAAHFGHRDMVALLLSRGAVVNAASVSGWTALMRACDAGQLDCARLLLDAGADPRMTNDEGYTAGARVPGNHAALLRLVPHHQGPRL